MSTKQRIMMISTHGYVAAEPQFGKPDTGGQVVYVLELSKCLARMGHQVDILTRQFEGQLIHAALEITRGRRIEAAHKLGIGRNTITRKIQELGLDD